MSFLNKLVINFFCKKIGEDQFGNIYYEGKNSDYLGNQKRYVVYRGIAEPSKVPPLWHAWLHYLSDDLPGSEENYSWQHQHLPNLTGTKFSYHPSSEKLREKVSSDYLKWKPKE